MYMLIHGRVKNQLSALRTYVSWAVWSIMHECVTTSTYSTRAKPEGCMYLWLRTSALYSYSPAWGVLTGL